MNDLLDGVPEDAAAILRMFPPAPEDFISAVADLRNCPPETRCNAQKLWICAWAGVLALRVSYAATDHVWGTLHYGTPYILAERVLLSMEWWDELNRRPKESAPECVRIAFTQHQLGGL